MLYYLNLIFKQTKFSQIHQYIYLKVFKKHIYTWDFFFLFFGSVALTKTSIKQQLNDRISELFIQQNI